MSSIRRWLMLPLAFAGALVGRPAHASAPVMMGSVTLSLPIDPTADPCADDAVGNRVSSHLVPNYLTDVANRYASLGTGSILHDAAGRLRGLTHPALGSLAGVVLSLTYTPEGQVAQARWRPSGPALARLHLWREAATKGVIRQGCAPIRHLVEAASP